MIYKYTVLLNFFKKDNIFHDVDTMIWIVEDHVIFSWNMSISELPLKIYIITTHLLVFRFAFKYVFTWKRLEYVWRIFWFYECVLYVGR